MTSQSRRRRARQTATTAARARRFESLERFIDRARTMHARTIGLRPTRIANAHAATGRARRRESLRAARSNVVGDARAVFQTNGFFANAVTSRAREVKARAGRGPTVMAAKVAGYIKLAIAAGKASPAPPIGPALGAKVRM